MVEQPKKKRPKQTTPPKTCTSYGVRTAFNIILIQGDFYRFLRFFTLVRTFEQNTSRKADHFIRAPFCLIRETGEIYSQSI